ncbi:major tail protein [Paenibacillus sp. BR1-192]|uniref:major tail protein n=1 Tax=Paenibacillus sp. BR1-192 TaxID=3032287 RepID=UPI00240DAB6F|nr:major tail protein [Paenibacillus sp. BR1-192]WFB57472.1 phage tail protein [Paenibacillus sp. BR1-192]
MSQNKVTFGLSRVHIAFVDDTATDLPAWETPVAVPGAVRLTPEAQGESSTFYADNTSYFVITSNNGYTCELEMANVPDDVKAKMLGWEVDDNGMLLEISDARPKKFALMGEVQGDKRNRRFVYYDCQADRPAKELTTKGESVEPNTDVFNMSVSPIEIDNRMVVKGDLELSETNATAFNSFFTAVYLPTFAVPTP